MSTRIEFSIDTNRPEPSVFDARTIRRERGVSVSESGDVRAYDEVAGHYSTHHDLTDEELATARDLAAKVRAGTHYVAGSRVYAVR